MKRKRFTEEQIILVLKEYEAGARVADLVRKHNVSEQSIYRWKRKYGTMEVTEAKRLFRIYIVAILNPNKDLATSASVLISSQKSC